MRSPSALWRHLRFRSSVVPPSSTTAHNGVPPAEAVGRLSALRTRLGPQPVTLLKPPAILHFAVSAGRGCIVRVPVALVSAATDDPLRMACQLSISRPTSGQVRDTHVTLAGAPGHRWSWVTAAMPPAVPGCPLEARITLTIGAAHANGHAWVACGPLCIDRPRTADQWRIAIRTFVGNGRAFGWRRSLRRALRGAAPHEPREDYAAWAARHAPTDSDLATQREEAAAWGADPATAPTVSVITPTYNTRPEWLRDCLASLAAQTYPHWQWCVADDGSHAAETLRALAAIESDDRVSVMRLPTNAGTSLASNAAIAHARGAILVLLDHDDVLTPDALFEVVSAFRADPELELLYSDEDKIDDSGVVCEPCFKPDWSPELFMGTMYTCHLTAMRRTLFERAGNFRAGFEGAQDYDLWLRMSEHTAQVHHISKVLYHWRKVRDSTSADTGAKPGAIDAGRRALEDAITRRGLDATVTPGLHPGHYRIQHRHRPVLTSILMPTYGPGTIPAAHVPRVCAAVASIVATTSPGQVEFVFATDDGELPPAVRIAAGPVPIRVVGLEGAFNFSTRINRAAAAAQGAMLLVANDDLEATEAGWLEALLDYGQQPGIGVVGPRLSLPDGRVQHAGILAGVRGVAAHAFHHAPPEHDGYFGSLIGPRNMSAVTGACLMTRAGVFAKAGGFDPRLPLDFNDVDYCLRVSALGLRVVFTPFARLIHHEGTSIGGRAPGADAIALMRDRWHEVMARDPFYNVNLSADVADYRLADAPRPRQ